MDLVPTKTVLKWSWLKQLIQIIDEYPNIQDISNKVRTSFKEFQNFEEVDMLVLDLSHKDLDSTTLKDKLVNSSFFDRYLIEELFVKRLPCVQNNYESTFPLEMHGRVFGLIHFKHRRGLTENEYNLLWAFTDHLSSKVNDLLIPPGLRLNSKKKIKEISNTIFNNLKSFLEASLEKLRVLEEQNQKLTEVNELRAELINNVSHELRTPLVSILGFSKILQRHEISADLVVESSEQIQSAGGRLSRMIDDLIQLNRASSKGWQVKFETLDIGEIAHFVVDSLAPLNPAHQFQFDFPDDYPLVNGDRKLLRQVLENLIINALKYSPQGGAIKSIITLEGDSLKFSIEDNGIGMSPEEKDKVFSRFFRAKNNKTENIAGLGLGLSICADVISAHYGEISVDSTLGEGSIFTITLPVS